MRKLKIKYRDPDSFTESEKILQGHIEPTPEMLKSPDESIRAALAYIGYGLDVLINDPSPRVRETVAINFYGLEVLINDPDPKVSQMAKRKIEQLKRDSL